MGTWVLADVEFSPGIPEQDEFYFDIDGTGYRIESGRKRPLIWWYADYSDSVLIKYVVEGEWVAYSLGYQLDPEDEEYKLMSYGLTWSGGIAVQRAPEAEEPGTPATPDDTVTFADAAEDILGVWALSYSRYEDTTVSTDPGDPLEFCFEEDGQGYVAYNGAEYPVTWQQTGEGSGWIAFECMWSVKTADGEIQYVYSLRYITDKNSEDFHQLIYDAADSYQVVMTKISGSDGTK